MGELCHELMNPCILTGTLLIQCRPRHAMTAVGGTCVEDNCILAQFESRKQDAAMICWGHSQ